MGPSCSFSTGRRNFIAPAKRKRRAARIWVVQSRRLTVLALEVDMAFSRGGAAAGAPEGFGVWLPLTITSNGQPEDRQARK
jgi:hypothetical protein